jgi:thiol-disulfide isomerase/thioredoxin
MKNTLTLILLAFTLTAYAQSGPLIGKQMADLQFSQILNYSKPAATLADFKSKVVILDFWATWCLPCIQAMPDLEKLQARFNKDIQIITVTDDPLARIQKFVEKQGLKLPIVIDKDGKLAEYFPHRTIPHTVIIDKNGIIRAITTPAELNETIIQKVIGNEPIAILEKRDNMDFDPSLPLSGNTSIDYQIVVTPYQIGLPSMANVSGDKNYLNRRIVAVNIGPQSLYEIAYHFPVNLRTEVNIKNKAAMEWNETNAICMDIIVPENKGPDRFEIMKQQLNNIFGYQISVEEKLKKVKVLRVLSGGAKLTLSSGAPESFSSGGTGLQMVNSNIKTVTGFLEDELQALVIDETNLTGRYDLKIDWYNENPGLIYQNLKKLGLELVDDNRKVSILVIADK